MSRRDAALWLALVTTGLLLTAVAVALDLEVGSPAAPFAGDYRLKVEIGTLLAPGVAAAVLLAVRAGLPERVPWRTLLVLAYAAAVAWTISLALVDGGNGLASPVARPEEYLADVGAVRDDPAEFVDTFTERARSYTVATRTHPPGPVLLLWALHRAGVTRPLTIGVLLTLLGCLTVPFVAVAARSLVGETRARWLLPVLVLAPYAVWVAVSMDAVVAAICAASVACAAVGSEPGRRPWWAVVSGVLLGFASLFSYAAGWLAAISLLICFRRRRVTTIALLGAGALVPLGVVRLMGFVWPDGLTAAQVDWSERIGPNRSWLVWIPLNLVLLVIACGPHVVVAARALRRSPAWPFVVGAGVAVAFALGSGLSRGEVERSWLPFFPWLLVPVADEGRPSPLLLGLGAAAAITIESVLRSAW